MPELSFPLYLVLLTTSAGSALETSSNGDLIGFKTLEEGLNRYTNAYQRHHMRSYEGSMSACINSIQFQRKLVLFKSMDAVKAVLNKPPYRLTSFSGVSGSAYGIYVREDKVKALEARGKTPALVR